MHVLITGGAGFLGRRLASALLHPDENVSRLTLVDAAPIEFNDPRVSTLRLDLSNAEEVRELPADIDLTYHLAAVVSAAAEADFDLGMRVNVEGARNVLEALREKSPGSRFVFTSSLAVFGSTSPSVVTDDTRVSPESSYGTQKAIGELLVSDYSRKGFVDGVTLRLPTVCVRPGKPNRAASSFASDIIREPLEGRGAVCPVRPSLELWLTSPGAAVRNLIHAGTLPLGELRSRAVNLSGITVTVGEMLETLEAVAGEAARAHVTFQHDPAVERIVETWPSRFDVTQAQRLGFVADDAFEGVVRSFTAEEAGARW